MAVPPVVEVPPLPPIERAHIHAASTFGERASDAVASTMGSWRFVITQNLVVFCWVVLNVIALIGFRWDPAPFILLNLVFSWQASNIGPVLQMTGNRAAQRDRLRDDTEAREVELSIELLHEMRALVADLHTHTECRGHTTIGEPPTLGLPPRGFTGGYPV